MVVEKIQLSAAYTLIDQRNDVKILQILQSNFSPAVLGSTFDGHCNGL